jgi:hypothetical protein
MRTATLKKAGGNAVELFSMVSGALVITTSERPLRQTLEREKAVLSRPSWKIDVDIKPPERRWISSLLQ